MKFEKNCNVSTVTERATIWLSCHFEKKSQYSEEPRKLHFLDQRVYFSCSKALKMNSANLFRYIFYFIKCVTTEINIFTDASLNYTRKPQESFLSECKRFYFCNTMKDKTKTKGF